MECVNDSISTCRHCHFYQLEGRRGGYCQQLGAPVQGSWQACSLGISPFAKWKQLAGISAWAPLDSADLAGDSPEPSLTPALSTVMSPETVLDVLADTELGHELLGHELLGHELAHSAAAAHTAAHAAPHASEVASVLESALLESVLESAFEAVRDAL